MEPGSEARISLWGDEGFMAVSIGELLVLAALSPALGVAVGASLRLWASKEPGNGPSR